MLRPTPRGRPRSAGCGPLGERAHRSYPAPVHDLSRSDRPQLDIGRQLGPYRIDAELYCRAVRQVALLESGQVLYKANDVGYPSDRVSNCIHAVSSISEGYRLRVASPLGTGVSGARRLRTGLEGRLRRLGLGEVLDGLTLRQGGRHGDGLTGAGVATGCLVGAHGHHDPVAILATGQERRREAAV